MNNAEKDLCTYFKFIKTNMQFLAIQAVRVGQEKIFNLAISLNIQQINSKLCTPTILICFIIMDSGFQFCHSLLIRNSLYTGRRKNFQNHNKAPIHVLINQHTIAFSTKSSLFLFLSNGISPFFLVCTQCQNNHVNFTLHIVLK